MKSSVALFILAALLLAGCHNHNNVNQQLLEREIRRQEDQIYALEDELDDYECQLASVQNENAALRKQATNGDRGALDSPGAPVIDLPGSSAPPPRRRDTSPAPGPGGPMLEPNVEIDPGEEFDPSQTPANGASAAGRVADQVPQRIVLNKQLTGGTAGGRGVLVVFEPRNKAGQMLELPGDVSIAVLDPQKQGPQARVARWDFTAEEARSHIRKTALGRGYHFELPWPSAPPANRRVQVFVRYITPDGRKLLADMHIDVSPSADREARRWHGVPPGSRRSLSSARGEAPRYGAATSTPDDGGPTAGAPTAKFLDPPQIVPETEEDGRSRPGRSRSYEDDEETREAVRKKQSEATSSRPVWSPFR